jgi:Fe-S-cluster containining protein
VPVTGADHARLATQRDADDLTHFDGNRCYMNMRDGHCAALTLDLATQQLVCSVYETRPSTCRDLERGSPACRAEFHEKGARPLALLSASRARD